jgi:flavin reductase (DIM6/NTAB) family NADH-FMN oxidoreductase RutF
MITFSIEMVGDARDTGSRLDKSSNLHWSSRTDEDSTLTSERIRHALGHFASGVTIVTSLGPDGGPVGTTASAVSSLSLDPPLMLVCLGRTSATLAALRAHGAFAVNVLAARQQDLSAHFARSGNAASWSAISSRPGTTGLPLLDGAVATLECELEQCVSAGDHEIVVGRLRDLEVAASDLEPLLHFRGTYASLRA